MAQVLQFSDVVVRRNSRDIVDHLDWSVNDDERWVDPRPERRGQDHAPAARRHADAPDVGHGDRSSASVSAARTCSSCVLASGSRRRRWPGAFPQDETVINVVLTAAFSVLGRWNEDYEDIDERRALRVLAEWKLDHLADRTFGTLSDGEQKRVQIARAVMTDPELLLLDEPTASLDLGAREELLTLLAGYAQAPTTPAMIMVTHHVEEIPVGFTHVLLIRDGGIVAAGPLDETLTAENLTATFGLPISLTSEDGRHAARAASA